MHYYKKNIGDYRRRAHSLTILEHGVYSQLLDEYYLNEKPLPKNIEEVCDEIGARSEEEIAAVHKILKKFFSLTKKGFQQTHCDEVISAYQANSLINKENGKKGGRPKGKTKRVNSDNPNESESTGNQEPLTTNHKPLSSNIKPKPIPQNKFENEDMNVAKHIYQKLLKMNPSQKKPNFNVWAMDINKINRLDKHSHSHIKKVFDWANQDDFWCTNILSPSKLRKQYDTLVIKMGAVKKQEAKLRLPFSDDDLWPYAQKHGLSKYLSGENFKQYRARLQKEINLRDEK